MIDLSPASLFISFVHVSVCIAPIPSAAALSPCLNLDATPRNSMTSTHDVFATRKQAAEEGPLHDKSTSPGRQSARAKCDLPFPLFHPVGCPFKLLISFLLMLLLKRSLVQIPRYVTKISLQLKNFLIFVYYIVRRRKYLVFFAVP